METIAKIRRAHFVQGKPIKAICRELKMSRKVVRKVLRSGETAFEYERTVQPMPKIGPCKDELDRILAENETKAGSLPGCLSGDIGVIDMALLSVIRRWHSVGDADPGD